MTPRQDGAGSGGADGQTPQSKAPPGGDALRTERIRILSDELRATRAELTASAKELDRTHRELVALRRRRSVRLALGVSRLLGPLAGAVRRVAPATAKPGGKQAVVADEPRKRLRATEEEEARLRSRLASVLRPARSASGPLVSIVIPTRDGLEHLQRLLPALDQLVYRNVEIVVVDNGSRDRTAEWLAANPPAFPMHVIANPENRSYAEANNQGVAVATGELILLLNNDTEPAGPHVLGHLVDRVVDDATVVAVGSRLIYPRRSGPAMGPVSAAADLSLQHRGVAFATVDGTQTAVHVGRGEDPLGDDASERREIAMATAACLLVRRSAFEAVGGFSGGYDYGMEDVDLALKLRAAGGRVMYEPQATFWHHESATQVAEARESRAIRQAANRALLRERWGPRIERETFLDRLSAAGSWASGPLHVGITLTRDDEHGGWGDWYTAHELGEALEAIGWRVSYLERWKDHWYAADPSIDVVVSLLDAFDVRRLPAGVVSVAWVRNWTERWIGQPWFEDFDIVLASSQRSRELIDGASVHVAGLMPLATNPVRFSRVEAGERVEGVDVAFTANRWGEARGVEAIAPVLAAAGRSVAVFGKGWEAVPEMAGVARGALAYDDLPAAYADAALVIDDTATPTLPYGAVNSRVFDALAAGTLVITDNVLGARELFGEALPAAGEPEEIVRLAERYLDDPAERRRLAIELRNVVIERHTYAHRAEELRGILERWASAPRVDIAISPPENDGAQLWGDFHFGRGVQRALHRRGLPARMRLRPSWAVPDASTADVLIHVFGAFGADAPAPRSGQLSIVWVISHPDLVTDGAVAPYDLVFVASDGFAARLAERLGRPVAALHQATDAERFAPRPGGPAHELLFVANSRGVRRRIVDELTPTDLDLAVFGRRWTPDLLDPRYLRGENVPNAELATYYAAASIVLNDHWSDMAEQGFMSNRLYDAAACGAFVISDRVEGNRHRVRRRHRDLRDRRRAARPHCSLPRRSCGPRGACRTRPSRGPRAAYVRPPGRCHARGGCGTPRAPAVADRRDGRRGRRRPRTRLAVPGRLRCLVVGVRCTHGRGAPPWRRRLRPGLHGTPRGRRRERAGRGRVDRTHEANGGATDASTAQLAEHGWIGRDRGPDDAPEGVAGIRRQPRPRVEHGLEEHARHERPLLREQVARDGLQECTERHEQLRDRRVVAIHGPLQVHAEVRAQQPLEVGAGDQALRRRIDDRPARLRAHLRVGHDRDPHRFGAAARGRAGRRRDRPWVGQLGGRAEPDIHVFGHDLDPVAGAQQCPQRPRLVAEHATFEAQVADQRPMERLARRRRVVHEPGRRGQ